MLPPAAKCWRCWPARFTNHDKIAELVESDLSLEGMGTTVTGAMFDGAQLGSGAHRRQPRLPTRDGHLERLTHDHTWVQSLVDDGKISENEAAMHPTARCC